ncbi:inner nuclear membrane protein Man1 isoform X2 [Aplysia californica]|uniref:Inner nuclear membrane protein Man1 isoform X2 n=1 Tax=Aplysia californica TaxID=6500 RepID=A0ABM1ADC8_APLCA|nr:inner nuclear membrane protein Man1 isoform X2 [Aplysia californica]
MADQDHLSDADLVAELQNYGESIGLPLKAGKRSILVKKLNHFKARAKLQDGSASKTVKPVSRAASRPAVARTPGSFGEGSASSSLSNNNKRPSLSRSYEDSPRTRSRTSPPQLDTLSSDDSDTEPVSSRAPHHQRTDPQLLPDRKRGSQFADSILRTIRRRTGDQLPTRQSARISNEVFELSAERERSKLDHSFGGGHDDSRFRSLEDEEIPVPSPARSRLYPNIKKFTSFLSNSHDNDNNFESSDSDLDASTYEVENKSINTSFPSHNFSARGSYLGSPSSSPSLESFRHRVLPRRRFSGTPRVQQYKSAFTEHLPHFLIAVAMLFFIVLSVTYAVNHRDMFFSWLASNNIGSDDELLLCPGGLPGEKCYTRGEIDRALGYIKTLFSQLSVKKGQVLCEMESPGFDTMAASQLEGKIQRESISESTALRVYKCCLDHILANPHWNIRALREDGSVATTANEVIKLESDVATMGFWCRLRRSFSTVLYGVFLFCTLIGCMMLVSMYIKYRLRRKEQEQREVFAMVEKIIDILQDHHEQTKGEDSDEPLYLAVQHVRDQLLPPAQRRKLQPIWEKAFEFIAANESRIRLETRLIHGDEFEVWQWLPPTSHNGKIWQGQAFGEMNDSNSNQRMYSPTPCLKIRNMFDSNVESEDDWEANVVDAVLEKLKNIEHIIHIFVDAESREGCVYLKCSSLEAAGKARLALHGWWFDGRLVTVKHLKLDHYHKRWPEALKACKPLRPSTNQMRSLSQPYYRSSLEMT